MLDDLSNTEESWEEYERFLFAEVELSAEVKAFLHDHPVGRYLVGRAVADVKEAVHVMLYKDLEKHEPEYQAARKKARAAQQIMDWLNEAIKNGEAAESHLIKMDAGE